MYINNDNKGILHIEGQAKPNVRINIQVFLLENYSNESHMPKTIFKEKITISSDIFHKICQKIRINSTAIEIIGINNKVMFRGINAGGVIVITCEDTNAIINHNEQEENINHNEQEQIISNTYVVKDLLNISKCKKLSPFTEIYMKDNSSMALVINVGRLGKMYAFISPIRN
jgi:hypothetical protein